ncbi:MAG TPA: adenine phosphoribosyltransferase [Gemmatimonadales bacterium]|nr:adenine phosphoribosyltransferase [Gemmatimonadales bacterium]
MIRISELIRTIPDYPKPGILFRDITTLFGHAEGFRETIAAFVDRYLDARVAKVAGVEARGFILGGAIAVGLGAGFVPIRKRGKLPARTVGHDYQLEYGTDRVEMHADAIVVGERVLVVDDLIATGGTAEAAVRLVEMVGGQVVECCFVIDLPDLGGRARLEQMGKTVYTLLEFPGH